MNLTLSIYRQLDEATFGRFEAVGRVRDKQGHTQKRQGGAAAIDWPRHRDWVPSSLQRTTAQLVKAGGTLRIYALAAAHRAIRAGAVHGCRRSGRAPRGLD